MLLRKRLLARLYDILILTIIFIIFIFLFNVESNFPAERGIYWQVIYIAYMTILPLLWNGYVVGKWFSHIKVKSINDSSLTFKNMVMRELVGFYLIGIATLGIAFIISAIMICKREDKRGIHDLIGSTYVTEVD